MANKLQITVDDDIYNIIKKLKPRTLKLFVSVAIEEFSKQNEAKLFFRNSEIKDELITKNKEEKVEVTKKSSIEEWN